MFVRGVWNADGKAFNLYRGKNTTEMAEKKVMNGKQASIQPPLSSHHTKMEINF